MAQIQINKTDFIADVEAGLTRAELKAKYDLPVSVINKWAKDFNLTITIKKAPKYVLVDNTIEAILEETVESLPVQAEEPETFATQSSF